MKITRASLQNYFENPLPTVADIADAFTFHAFEIDSVEGETLDVKVLPNRAPDCSSEEGIAKELSAILDVPLKTPKPFLPGNTVALSLARINGILGSNFSQEEVESVFRRLGFAVEMEGELMKVTAPAERVDITIAEDIAEEVGRSIGYDKVAPVELQPMADKPDQARYRGVERMKDQLVEQGFTEISTQSFAVTGDVYLANPMDKTHPALRNTLEENLKDALVRANQYAPLVLGPNAKPKLFEIGTVFPASGEFVELRMSERVSAWGDSAGTFDNLSVAKLEEYGKDYEPKKYALGVYKQFSVYPFATRDIAFWVPAGTEEKTALDAITGSAGVLLARCDLFDTFAKGDKVSYAFRLVFQSFDHTLSEEEINAQMFAVTDAVKEKGWEVR